MSSRGRSQTKKALLIGIEYRNERGRHGQKLEPIPTSIPNVNKFANFLREHCGYTDVIIMTDGDGVDAKYQPTKLNLKREIRAFSRGVRPGDRRVFYYAGHSDQMPCKTGSEEDNQDEVLVALNGQRIRDNTLYNWLVKGLPKGSALTAIFDSCTSGTLLDLEHYRCNNVYRPWVNKGRRRSNTLRNGVVRKNGRVTRSWIVSPPSSRRGSGEANVRFPSILQRMDTPTTPVPSPDDDSDSDKHYGQRTASPERQFCEGWCRTQMQRKGSLQHADVVSISSSNDGQISWDASTRNGDSVSMTSFFIDIMKQHPEITYQELMTRLNHKVHLFTMGMHSAVQRESRARRKAEGKITDSEDTDPEEDKGEMDNFQDLQLGSITPVDMDRVFVL